MGDRDPRSGPNARFLRADALAAGAPVGSLRGALGVSAVTHAVAFLLLALAMTRVLVDGQRSTVTSATHAQIVWVPQPGAPHGGGGSGNGKREPARRVELPGHAAPTVPAVRVGSSLTDTPPPDQSIQISAVPLSADDRTLPGIVTTLSLVSTDSQGPGSGGRGGQGAGTGSGPGRGPGMGDGEDGGMGGRAYQVGNGVVGPRLIKETKPSYTAEAMRARIQGLVTLEAIVLPDGSVGPVRIVRSLDQTFGLDDAALAAVKSWRFVPATLAGRAVPVLVNIELAFTLR